MRNTGDKLAFVDRFGMAGDFGLLAIAQLRALSLMSRKKPKEEPPPPPPKRIGPKLTKAQKKARKKERTQLRLADQRALKAVRLHEDEEAFHNDWDLVP